MSLTNVIASGDGVGADTLRGGAVRIRILRSTVIKTGVAKSTNRPYTLSSLTATLTDVACTPITGDLRTFDSFDGAEYSVTIEPDERTIGSFMVKKVRDAAAIRASRNAARAKLVGSPDAPPADEQWPATDQRQGARIVALEERVTSLEQRLELALSLFTPPEGA